MPSLPATVTSRRATPRSAATRRAPTRSARRPDLGSIRRVVPAVALAAALGFGAWTGAANGQTVKSLPSQVIVGTDPNAIRAAAGPFVKQQAKRLADAGPAEAADARQSLLSPLAGGAATGQFLATYASEIADAIAPVATNNDPRVRLNAAIVVARVAEASGSTDLTDPIKTLLQDSSPGVVIWAVKASASVLPFVQNDQLLRQRAQLDQAVVAAVKANPDSGPIAQEAYNALILKLDNRGFMQNPPQGYVGRVLPGALESVHEMLAFRLDLYGAGVTPPEPAVEQQPVNFLVDVTVWPRQTPPGRQRSIEQMAALALRASEALNDPGAQDDGLKPLLAVIGSGFRVVGQLENQSSLGAAAQRLASATGPTATSDQITAAVGTLLTAVGTAFPEAQLPTPSAAGNDAGDNAGATAGATPSASARR